MKTKTQIIMPIVLAIALLSIVGCSKDDDPEKRESYVKYNISGVVVNDNFRIFANGEDSDYTNVDLTGGLVINVESNEGNIKMTAIGYRGYGHTMDDVREVTFKLPPPARGHSMWGHFFPDRLTFRPGSLFITHLFTLSFNPMSRCMTIIMTG